MSRTSALNKKLKKTFNLWIRLRDSNSDNYGFCCTCNKKVHYKKADAGHFIHGLNFVEDNQHLQCKQCNKWKHGDQTNYTLFMLDKYGRERIEELKTLRKKIHKRSISELENMFTDYKNRVNTILKERVG